MYSKSSESPTTADAAGSKLIVGAPNRHNPGETIDAVETNAVWDRTQLEANPALRHQESPLESRLCSHTMHNGFFNSNKRLQTKYRS
jgi:hypothetical protein